MKKAIHPTYDTATITCNSCSTVYTLGSTGNGLKVELCSNCHPFYTGKEILVDTDNLVDKFNKRRSLAKTAPSKANKRKERSEKKKGNRPTQAVTLRDMLSNIK